MSEIKKDLKEENKKDNHGNEQSVKSKNNWILPSILIFVVICIVISVFSGGGSLTSEKQNQFTDEWRLHRDRYVGADTDVKKNDFRSKGYDHLNKTISVDNWFGRVEEVGSDYVTVESQGIKYYLYPKGENVNYLDFDKGMGLYFTGILNGKYWLDDLKSPGIYVDCFSILGDDKNKSYFKISDSEMSKYLKSKKATEELYEELKNIGNEFKDAFKQGLEDYQNDFK